jgi:hypothetical protein
MRISRVLMAKLPIPVLTRLIYSPIIDPTKLLDEVCKETQHNSLFVNVLLADSKSQILQINKFSL